MHLEESPLVPGCECRFRREPRSGAYGEMTDDHAQLSRVTIEQLVESAQQAGGEYTAEVDIRDEGHRRVGGSARVSIAREQLSIQVGIELRLWRIRRDRERQPRHSWRPSGDIEPSERVAETAGGKLATVD